MRSLGEPRVACGRRRAASEVAGHRRLGALLVSVGRSTRGESVNQVAKGNEISELPARRPRLERARRPRTAPARAWLERGWSSTSTAARAATPARRRSPPWSHDARRRACSRSAASGSAAATNNVAEYRALLLGIERAAALGASEVELVGDSELIVNQVKGEYRVKDASLRELHGQVRAALGDFERWSIRHVRREQNAAADRLVNEALDDALGAPGNSVADVVHYPAEDADPSPDRPRGRRSATSTSRSPTSTARSTSTAACSASSCMQRYRRRGRVRLRRRLPPPHRAQHLAARRAARRRRRAPPASSTPRSATRPARALADALRRLREAGVPLDGASDHGVSEALYLRDPDSNGVELYWDRPQEEWPRDPSDRRASRCSPRRSTSPTCSPSSTARLSALRGCSSVG